MRRASVALLVVSAFVAPGCRTRQEPGLGGEAEHAVACPATNTNDDVASCRADLESLLVQAAPESARERATQRTLARAEAERLVAESRALGDATESELDEAATAVWPRWNDGPVVDVVHALFAAGPDADRSARAFASSLVSPASEESFRSAAKVAGASAVERINGVGNRGRTLAGLVLVREFSDAAVRLTTASPRSDVVHTSYGSHIVLLLSRYEPEPFAASERVRALREEALNRRVRARIAAVREKYPSELQIEALQTLEIPASSP